MRLAYRLINLSGLFRLLYQLRKLLSDSYYLILNICFELFFLLLQAVAQLEVFLENDVELTSQVPYILRRLILLHVAEVGYLTRSHGRHLPVTSRTLTARELVLLLDQMVSMSAAKHSRIVLVGG